MSALLSRAIRVDRSALIKFCVGGDSLHLKGMTMLQLKWFKCGDDRHWCSFENLNVETASENGVYVVWHEGNPGHVVYVGQGAPVGARIATHRKRTDIMAHAKKGKLRVTWAAVPAAQRDGVERYLADQWSPLVGDAHPDVQPIAVNAPW